jgi:hypothetical protein
MQHIFDLFGRHPGRGDMLEIPWKVAGVVPLDVIKVERFTSSHQ